jgi:hypothetical protein
MKVDSRSFPKSICTPKSKSIRGRGGRHKLAAVLESECQRCECNSVSFLSTVPKQQNRIHISII